MKCPICNEEVRDTEQAQRWGPEFAHSTCVTAYNYGMSDARAALAAQPGAVGEHEALAERIREAHDMSLDGEHRECRTALLRIANALAAAPTEAKPAQDAVDAERWREFRTGKALTVKCKKATVMFGPNPEADYPDALDAAIDAARASKGTP